MDYHGAADSGTSKFWRFGNSVLESFWGVGVDGGVMIGVDFQGGVGLAGFGFVTGVEGFEVGTDLLLSVMMIIEPGEPGFLRAVFVLFTGDFIWGVVILVCFETCTGWIIFVAGEEDMVKLFFVCLLIKPLLTVAFEKSVTTIFPGGKFQEEMVGSRTKKFPAGEKNNPLPTSTSPDMIPTAYPKGPPVDSGSFWHVRVQFWLPSTTPLGDLYSTVTVQFPLQLVLTGPVRVFLSALKNDGQFWNEYVQLEFFIAPVFPVRKFIPPAVKVTVFVLPGCKTIVLLLEVTEKTSATKVANTIIVLINLLWSKKITIHINYSRINTVKFGQSQGFLFFLGDRARIELYFGLFARIERLISQFLI